jgi:RHS repeat-associated protein
VSNAGFESGSVSPWTVLGSATAAVTTAVAHSGNDSLSVTGPSGGAGVYQDITGLTPGQSYVASVWAEVSNGSLGYLYLDDTAGGNVLVVGGALAGGWQYLSAAYTADSTGAVRVHLWSNYGTTYFDDVSLTPATSLTYDAFDRLQAANGATYSYDAFGRRIQRTFAGGMQRLYFYDPSGKLLAEYDNPSSGAGPSRTTQYFAGQRVGQWTDRVGSKRADSGSSSQYYPYGEEITSTNNDTYKFAQTYRDSDSGLDYAVARYYGSSIGRFLTADRNRFDRTQPQSLNLYAYTAGDPINAVDGAGLDECFVNNGNCDAAYGCLSGTDDDYEPSPLFYTMLCPVIPALPTAPPPKPCWDSLADVATTLGNLATDAADLAQQAGISTAGLSFLDSYITGAALDELVAISTAVVSKPYAKPPDFEGGHFDLNLTWSTIQGNLSAADYAAFAKAFNGTRNNWQINGTQYNLHSKRVDHKRTDDIHFDRYNPQDVVGIIMHGVVDVGVGQLSSKCLDPAWQ